MDYMDAFFNKNKPFQPIIISGGTSNGRVVSNAPVPFRERIECAEKQQLEQEVHEMQCELNDTIKQTQIGGAPEGLSNEEIYKKYTFSHRSLSTNQLPIHASKIKLMSKIEQYPVVVIEGATGCGKSTQVPQMILDDAKENGKACNIIVTQPRRIAARSIADRVCIERGWKLGTLVGYQIGLDKNYVSEDTRMLFVTTGVLLEKLVQTKSLAQYTHIILDEVHERSKDMDFLFIIIRMLWAQSATTVKIILMSATIDTDKFVEYFRFYQFGDWMKAPVFKVGKENTYNVKKVYLEDFGKQLSIPAVNVQSPGITDEMMKFTLHIIRSIEKEDTLYKSILVFLPGIYEIGKFNVILTDYARSKGDISWKIIILHSLISSEEQQSVFKTVDHGTRKIILSTNIAESSITVPDVKHVIDFCLMKIMKSDSMKNCTRLEMDWASKSNCEQRAGRAGRVDHGRCYRMVTRHLYELYLKESSTPELLITPLENIILKTKTFEMGAPHLILGLAMDRPPMEDISNTVMTLKGIGAMLLSVGDKKFSSIDGDLTFLGRMMSALPIDVRASRLIAIGFCFGLLEECIIMAAGLTTKSIFKITFEKNLNEYSRRLEWSNGSGSDLFAILNAFNIWTLKYNQKEFGNSKEQQRAERDFCRRHYLDVRSLHECHQLVRELTNRLDKLGIREQTGKERIHWTDQERVIILKVVIAGAFYPNFFATIPNTNPMMEREIFRTLNGRDPNNTVFFRGFSQENIRQLYVEPIRNLFKNVVIDEENIDAVKVSFDESERVFITFDTQNINDDIRTDWDTKRCSIPGHALTEIYKAVKMRKMRMNTYIPVMNVVAERKLAEHLGLGVSAGEFFTLKPLVRDDVREMCIPNVTQKEILGKITHIENCSKFWIQPKNEQKMVQEFVRELNIHSDLIEQFTPEYSLNREMIIVARDHKDDLFRRARLISWDNKELSNESHVVIWFIDSGHTQKCQLGDLYKFTRDVKQSQLPPRVFPARLAEIQASTSNISGGFMWESAANELFTKFVQNDNVKVEIYSIVNGSANVVISVNNISVNDVLIKQGYGEFCEENFMSKKNRWMRQNAQSHAPSGANSGFDMDEYLDRDDYFAFSDAIAIKDTVNITSNKIVHLNGPSSPLEADVYSVLLNSHTRSVTIDAHSVNSVLLNSMQQEQSIKYMVAAHISQKSASDKDSTAHESTLLPNIRGLGPLIAMVFCPAMDLKRDQWKSRYISLRTGLGYNDEKGCPYFSEHDAIFPLDFELTADDLRLINQMRYSIDTMLYTFDNAQENDTLSTTSRIQLMQKLKDVSIELLSKSRNPIEIHTVTHDWKEYDPNEFNARSDVYGGKSIFPLHGIIELKAVGGDAKNQLKKHCAALYDMAISMNRAVMCQLCMIDIENVEMMRTHLMSRLHSDRETQIGFDRSQKVDDFL